MKVLSQLLRLEDTKTREWPCWTEHGHGVVDQLLRLWMAPSSLYPRLRTEASGGRDGAGVIFNEKRKTAREWLTFSLIKEHISGWIAPYLQLTMPSPEDRFWKTSAVSVGLHLGGINSIRAELKLWSSKRMAGSELAGLCSGPQESDTAQRGVGELALTQRVSARGGPDDGFGLENVTITYLHHNVYNGGGWGVGEVVREGMLEGGSCNKAWFMSAA